MEGAAAQWQSTGSPRFPLAARLDGAWWVLRMNPFPDHPLWTVFVDGSCWGDFNNWPPEWAPRPDDDADPREVDLGTADAADALTSVDGLAVYGTESGQPCDNPFCCHR